MTRLTHIATVLVFLAAHANAFFFDDIRNVYITASDGKAYDFYVNGNRVGSGKRVHHKTSKDDFCKLEIYAKIGDRIYGKIRVGKGFDREERGLGGNLIHDIFAGSDSDRGCPEDVVVPINPATFINEYKPQTVNNTNWNAPIKDRDYLSPKSTPRPNDWSESPFNKKVPQRH